MQFVYQSGNFPEMVESLSNCCLAHSLVLAVFGQMHLHQTPLTLHLTCPLKEHFRETFILLDKLNSIISKTSIIVNDLGWKKHFTS